MELGGGMACLVLPCIYVIIHTQAHVCVCVPSVLIPLALLCMYI